MSILKAVWTSTVVCATLGAITTSAVAAPTQFPITVENCGAKVTVQKAPQRAVGLGQNSAEILLLLGLQDRMVGTAFWPSKVLPQLAEANAKVKLLTVEFPTFESILAENPDFVAASLPSLLGESSKVAKRQDFEKVGVPGLSFAKHMPGARRKATTNMAAGPPLWNMDLLYQEIDELSRIFDVADRGQALIADFKAREATLRNRVSTSDKKLSYVFWFSSPTPDRGCLSRRQERRLRLHRRSPRRSQRRHGRSRVADARLGKHHRDQPGRDRRGQPGSQSLGTRQAGG